VSGWELQSEARDHDCVTESGVAFNRAEALGLSSSEVRERWPRKVCPKCGAVCYESFAHYVMGDW
jgi:hypothetical protein